MMNIFIISQKNIYKKQLKSHFYQKKKMNKKEMTLLKINKTMKLTNFKLFKQLVKSLKYANNI